MPVTFEKKLAGKAPAHAAKETGGAEDEPQAAKKSTTTKKQTAKKAPAKSGGGQSWMMTGPKAKAAFEEEEAKTEAKREAAQRMFRFYLLEDEEAQITFLAGDVDDNGEIQAPMWFEHKLFWNGNWETFVCTAATEPCPMCEGGSQPTLVAGFPVINHTPYKIKRGPNQGKVLKDRPVLYIATRKTLKILQKIAAKQGGLAGWTMDVSRTSKEEPRVGNVIVPVGHNSLAALKKQFGEVANVFDVGEEIPYRSAAELKKMGVGVGQQPAKGEGEEPELEDEIPF